MTYDKTFQSEEWTVHRVGQGILREGDAVLLSANRWYSDKPPVWTLPGGRAEAGEGTGEALVREFREETGLDVEVGELAYVVESRSVIRRQLFLVCVFEVRRLGGTLSCEGDEGVVDLRFVPLGELSAYLHGANIGPPLLHHLQHPEERPGYWFFPEYATSG